MKSIKQKIRANKIIKINKIVGFQHQFNYTDLENKFGKQKLTEKIIENRTLKKCYLNVCVWG